MPTMLYDAYMGPIIVVVPAPVSESAGDVNAAQLPEISVICDVVLTIAGPKILPVMVIIEFAAGVSIMPDAPKFDKVPLMSTVTRLVLHVSCGAPLVTILPDMLIEHGEVMLNV